MAKGRQFRSLSAEDQQIIANGLITPNGGMWKHNWNTNDIDNEFTTMDKWSQDYMLTNMDNARKQIKTKQLNYDNNRKAMDQAWAPYGGAPAGSLGGIAAGLGNQEYGQAASTTGYVPKTDGSDAWKFKGATGPGGMKNPTYIGGKFYDVPIQKAAPAAPAAPADPANLSGGQPAVPSVASRMSRMGQAVLKGVGKGALGFNQLGKYIPAGYTQQANTPTAPIKPTAPASPLVDNLASRNKNVPDANSISQHYIGAPPNTNGYKTPVSMPQKSSVKA